MELPTKRPDYSKFIEDADTGELIQVHDSRGSELPDEVPMAPPLGYTKPLSMFDQMRAQIRQEHLRLQQMALEDLSETPEQANDFDVDEDVENQPSLYEEKFDPVDFELRSRLRQAEFRRNFDAAVDKLPDHQKELLSGDNLGLEPARKGSSTSRDRGSDRDEKPGSREVKTSRVQGSVSKGSDAVADHDGED